MSKKIVIFLFSLLPLTMMAQDIKLGHINSQEVIMAMPEVKTMEETLDKMQKEIEAELLKMREEYSAKLKDYQEKLATMPASIKEMRESELIGMEQRINTYTQSVSADLQQKQNELLMPIIDKMKKALDEVSVEGNYTYVFDLAQQSVVYHSPKSNDITPLVKKKLGLK